MKCSAPSCTAEAGARGSPTQRHTAMGTYERLSGFIPMLPYIDQGALYGKIQQGDATHAPGGSAGWDAGWSVWNVKIPTYQCPSDREISAGNAQHNYAFSMGDGPIRDNVTATNVRGLFAFRRGSKISDITDGTSNTIAAERTLQGGIRAVTTTANSHSVVEGIANSVTFGSPAIPGVCLARASGGFFIPGISVKGKRGYAYTDGQPGGSASTQFSVRTLRRAVKVVTRTPTTRIPCFRRRAGTPGR